MSLRRTFGAGYERRTMPTELAGTSPEYLCSPCCLVGKSGARMRVRNVHAHIATTDQQS